MPTLEQTVTASTTTTTQLKLKPAIRAKLLRELRVYAELHQQKKAIELAMEKHKGVVSDIRNETGKQSIELEGFKVTLVAPIRKKFDAKKFVTLGGDIEIYNAANIDTPSAAYDKISFPGTGNGHEEK
jgi:hypothetical protein